MIQKFRELHIAARLAQVYYMLVGIGAIYSKFYRLDLKYIVLFRITYNRLNRIKISNCHVHTQSLGLSNSTAAFWRFYSRLGLCCALFRPIQLSQLMAANIYNRQLHLKTRVYSYRVFIIALGISSLLRLITAKPLFRILFCFIRGIWMNKSSVMLIDPCINAVVKFSVNLRFVAVHLLRSFFSSYTQ